jgi:hypothetical protein
MRPTGTVASLHARRMTSRVARASLGAQDDPSDRLRTSDYWRRSPASAGGAAGHKEWTHFCVLGPGIDLLVNFSLMDGVQTGLQNGVEIPRLAVLARDENGWEGEVVRFEPEEVTVAGGSIDCRFGRNLLRFVDGCYELDLDVPGRGLSASLRFEPLVTPAMTNSVPLGSGESVKWLVVPRLTADGAITIAGRRHRLASAPAYHDHNWGAFRWGGDFSWEWAVAIPVESSVPWTIVLTRLSDRAQHRVYSEGLLLWKGDTHWRTFRGDEVEFRADGFLRRKPVLRVPPVMWLAAPGRALDVPRIMRATGRSGRDAIELEIELEDLGQIAIPSDADAHTTTVLSEVLGSARLSGRVRGEPVESAGRAIVELVRVVR